MSEVDFKPVTSSPTGDFEPEQKRYLEAIRRRPSDRQGGKRLERDKCCAKRCRGAGAQRVQYAAAFKAQDRVLASGGKLSDQEKFKREQHPFDTYERRHVAEE